MADKADMTNEMLSGDCTQGAMSTPRFPDGFLFGGATSDWQFEGASAKAGAACSPSTSPPMATRRFRAR